MLERHHFWSFKDKDQRRHENELEKQDHIQTHKDRMADIAAHTHLDHIGRKGFLGLAHSVPSFFRHSRNAIYARWARGQAPSEKND